MTSGSGSSQAANCWSLGEVFEEILWYTCHPLSIHIGSLFIINQSAFMFFTLLSPIFICFFSSLTYIISWLPCFYCLVITLQISGHDQGFCSSFCCGNNYKYCKEKHPNYCAFLGSSFQTASPQAPDFIPESETGTIWRVMA